MNAIDGTDREQAQRTAEACAIFQELSEKDQDAVMALLEALASKKE